MQPLRKASAYNVYGLWVQRNRGRRLPYHRLSKRENDRHADQFFSSLQRQIPFTCNTFVDLFRRRCRRIFFIARVGFTPDRADNSCRWNDIFGVKNPLNYAFEGLALGIYSRAAAIPKTSDLQDPDTLGLRPHDLRFRQGCNLGTACRNPYMAYGKSLFWRVEFIGYLLEFS